MDQSRYRFVRCEVPKAASVAADLAKPSPSNTASLIAASASYVAAASSAPGGVVIQKEAEPVFVAASNSKAINDLMFSPFDDNLLFTVANDDKLAVLRLNDSIASVIWSANIGSSSSLIRAHPSCSGIISTLGSNRLALIDLERMTVLKNVEFGENPIASAEFSIDGSSISVAAVVGNVSSGKLSIVDPRQVKCDLFVDLPLRPHSVIDMRSDSKLIVLGQDQYRNPRLILFDQRNLQMPLFTESIQLSAGICLPYYDPDTSLLALSTRGSTSLHIYDMSRSDRLYNLTAYASPFMFQGIAAKAKRSLDVNNAEIDRILQLTVSSIETISLTVPRKTRDFAAELYPETCSTEPTLIIDEYLQGRNACPRKNPLNPNKECKRISDGVVHDFGQASRSDPFNIAPSKALALLEDNKSENRKKLEARMKKSLVAHVSGQESRSLDALWYGLKTADYSMPLGLNILVNNKYIVVPWKSLGASSLGVIDTAKKGRVDVQMPLLRAHGQQLSAFDVSSLDPDLIVTGCVDAHVRMWKLPFDGITADLTDPMIDILTMGRVTFLALNPVSASVLAVASQSYEAATVCLYDITSANTSSEPLIRLDGHPEQITGIAFSDDGNLLATTCKDRRCRIFDPRKSPSSPSVSFEMQEGVRDTHVIWMGDSGCIMTVGFGNASTRQISIYSVASPNANLLEAGKLLASHVVDQTNTTMVPKYDHDLGLLYIAGIGEKTILFFGIDLKKEMEIIEPLGKYLCNDIVNGIVWLPKTMCNVENVEVGSALYLTGDQVKPISFTIPRKRKEYFQDDLYPPTLVVGAGIPAAEWFNGVRFRLVKRSLRPKSMEPLSAAPPEEITAQQLKRLSFITAEKEQQNQPTVQQHIQSRLSNLAMDVAPTNRWDSQPIQDTAVAEDEWD